MDRLAAEGDIQHKQILTYIMVTRNGSVLSYKRGTYTRAEDFLRGSYCVGFGGHVTSYDLNLFSAGDIGVSACAVRELGEELKLPELDRRRLENGIGLKVVGVLNDDSSIVGQRHFAFLFQYEVSDDLAWDNPERGEKSITQLKWLHKDSAPIQAWHFEYWSQLCLREFFAPLIRSAPAYRINKSRTLQAHRILCVLGRVGSGKSETTQILHRDFGYKEINSGYIVASLLGIPPVPTTPREVFQRKAEQFIATPKGPDRLVKSIVDQIKLSGGQKILVDGIRHRRTIDKLRESVQDMPIALLYVHTPHHLAFNFFKEREQPNSSFLDFLEVRNAQVEEEIESLIDICDAILYNWAGIPAYEKAVHELFSKIAS